jgi:hypothetical protein
MDITTIKQDLIEYTKNYDKATDKIYAEMGLVLCEILDRLDTIVSRLAPQEINADVASIDAMEEQLEEMLGVVDPIVEEEKPPLYVSEKPPRERKTRKTKKEQK